MSETKDATLNPLLLEFNKFAPKGKQLKETSTWVGGSVPIGTSRVIAGFSCEVYTSQDGATHPWIAVRFTDGTAISLRSLMGVPSLDGFIGEGTLPVDEYTGSVLPSGEREQTTHEIAATASIELDSRYTAPTWCINDFLNKVAPNLVGCSVTYYGTALKPYIVRRPFGNQVPGGRAVLSVDLWTVDKTATTADAPTE